MDGSIPQSLPISTLLQCTKYCSVAGSTTFFFHTPCAARTAQQVRAYILGVHLSDVHGVVYTRFVDPSVLSQPL
jgi:hypothetical protein